MPRFFIKSVSLSGDFSVFVGVPYKETSLLNSLINLAGGVEIMESLP